MPLISTETIEITIPTKELKQFLYELQTRNIKFEALNPHELGEEWNSVIPLSHNPLQNDSVNLDLLSEAIELLKPKSFFTQFVDTRVSSSLEETLNILTRKNELLGFARSVIEEQNQTDKEELYKHLSQLHAAIELEQNTNLLISKFFTVKAHSDTAFGFLAIPKNKTSEVYDFLKIKNVPFSIIHWPVDISLWVNPGGLAAFQSVLQSLGTITKHELDPTIVVAFFYMVFFAFCLGDALYGLLISLVTGYFLYFTKLRDEYRNTFNLFFFSGLATVIFGALINSWAGNLFSTTPVNNVLGLIQLIDPLNTESNAPINTFLRESAGGQFSPIVFLLGLAVVIGIITIIIGYIFNTINALRRNNKEEFLSEASWLFFIFSIFTAIGFAALAPSQVIIGLGILAIGVFLQFIFNSGKGLTGKIFSGLIRIYDLISFFADILSFTRLVAVGLTSGIIANVINLLAGLVFTSTGPILGGILAAIILVLGHGFNLIVALFGAYINPLRLNYVEFLPKFFKGSGRELNSDSTSLRYINVSAS